MLNSLVLRFTTATPLPLRTNFMISRKSFTSVCRSTKPWQLNESVINISKSWVNWLPSHGEKGRQVARVGLGENEGIYEHEGHHDARGLATRQCRVRLLQVKADGEQHCGGEPFQIDTLLFLVRTVGDQEEFLFFFFIINPWYSSRPSNELTNKFEMASSASARPSIPTRPVQDPLDSG
ncbi:hypothetical protein E2C01_012771 [Portunus trituberculatus]|uniref:Uncharacterized protein n=1 Tax=Portunus trituberculatus TaxID=210409 RepID=A0A5B7DEK3_PORTR|nr:hypothetical protein [Portunus trituberculatus]